jgi:outer membrane protein OmpA-like peptidoglycan-associated protein
MSKLNNAPMAAAYLLAAGMLAAAPTSVIAQVEAPADTAVAPADATPPSDSPTVAAPPDATAPDLPPSVPPTDVPATDFAAPVAAPAVADVPANTEPLYADGPYGTALLRLDYSDGPLKFGYGGSLGAGLRRGPVAFEINAVGTRSHSSTLLGGTLDGLVFPFQRLPGLFAIAGVGATYVNDFPGIGGTTFNVTNVEGGAGYLLPLHLGSYEVGLRAQVLYEFGKRQKRAQDQYPPGIDIPAQSNFHEIVASIGLQFPFGQKPAPLPPPDRPMDVVAPVEPPPPPPKPECRTPVPGERINLEGCGTGDVIVLNGVNFEFNKATLTDNAKTILNDVDSELIAHPDIKVELAGHTDGRGSESYNLKLSQRRSESVRSYLMEHGVDGDRMTAVGYGKTQPIASNDTDEGRALNRRTELRITASNGEAASGVSVPTGVIDAAPVQTPPADSAAP